MKFKMSNETYDMLKPIAMRVLYGLATLILAIGQIWKWELAQPIAMTVTAVGTFLGTILGISTDEYNRMIEDNTDGNNKSN